VKIKFLIIARTIAARKIAARKIAAVEEGD